MVRLPTKERRPDYAARLYPTLHPNYATKGLRLGSLAVWVAEAPSLVTLENAQGCFRFPSRNPNVACPGLNGQAR